MTEPVSGDRASDIYHGPDNQTPSPAGCFGGWRKGKRFSPRGSVFRAQAPWPAPRRSCRGRGRKGSSTGRSGTETAGPELRSDSGPAAQPRPLRTAAGRLPALPRALPPGAPLRPSTHPRPRQPGHRRFAYTSPRGCRLLPAPLPPAGHGPVPRRSVPAAPAAAGRVLALPAAPRAPRGRAGTALGSAPPALGPRTRFDPPSPQLQGLHLRAGGCRSRSATAAPAQECPVLWLFPSVSPPSGTDGWPCCPGRGA